MTPAPVFGAVLSLALASGGNANMDKCGKQTAHYEATVAVIVDALRALRDGGHIVIYAPNRLYPFETHGIYWRGSYKFGNKFGVNWLPDSIRRKLVPHAKAYRAADMFRLWTGLPVKLVVHAYVYPGFDNIATRSPRAGRALRNILYRAEATPVRRFGLSHFVVLQKLIDPGVAAQPS